MQMVGLLVSNSEEMGSKQESLSEQGIQTSILEGTNPCLI